VIARISAIAAMVAAVAWTYFPAAGFAFLNWDDQSVILQNPSLTFPGVVRWAFTTTYMEHYLPLSWLAWAAIKAAFGLDAGTFHTANIAAHAVCALLVYVAVGAVLIRAVPESSVIVRHAAAVAAALLFGLHPLRVEVVAWISAMPYALALAFMLASLIAYLRTAARAPTGIPVAAILLYAASLAARPVALGFPAGLVILDVWLLDRRARTSLAVVWPFALLAVVAAGIESIARAPGINATPWLFRVQSAASAPFVYLWHTIAPVSLTPLDVLPADPVASIGLTVAALLALTGACLAAWIGRHRWPALAAAWAGYLALLAPAAGLVPSGLQATADRYTYLPAVVVAIAVAVTGARWASARKGRSTYAVGVVLVLLLAETVTARRVLMPWSDSVSLWSRVVTLDPRHDVGLYNLGAALAAEGRSEEAAERYRQVLALRPDHADARANLDRLDAAHFEREGNELAARGDLVTASERYRQAIALDPRRTHSQASLGMALATLGRADEALPILRDAVRLGTKDPAVPNALGVLLLQSGQTREARSVLETAIATHPDDVSLAHNLARLLATSGSAEPKDAALALRLADAVVQTTAGRDPRAMATLAAALAMNGRVAEAVAVNANAAALAAAQGDRDLAVQITARGRAYRRPGQ
jgi:tetratricopeptide (TPR) repeat protein